MSIELREKNTSQRIPTGSKWKTKDYGTVTVIGQVNIKISGGYSRFLVEFEDGKRIITTTTSITKRCNIKNPWQPTVYGVGFIGRGSAISHIVSDVTREYNLWMHMLCRCYSGKFETYKDCTVDVRWHNYQNFYHDIKVIYGYNRWFLNKEKMQIDKDIKIPGNKIYSVDTCLFVTAKENAGESNVRGNLAGNKYLATRISDGYTEELTNMAAFGRKYNCDRSRISECTRGKIKSTKGWSFAIID